jgi:hypothetical protein
LQRGFMQCGAEKNMAATAALPAAMRRRLVSLVVNPCLQSAQGFCG